ncbi:hypothetical protein HMPREF9099_02342 [Lachnospiraceae bacterium oral taxon 082 str. F0431]|nr:hypothetical protein HMPREF9099_02342 [Lachnospiraceae bacterium oral taxon 082 str. F0431]
MHNNKGCRICGGFFDWSVRISLIKYFVYNLYQLYFLFIFC